MESVPEAYETSLAFFHEIGNTIFDDDSPFIEEISSISQNPDDICGMIRCDLKISSGTEIGIAANYLLAKWHERLSYIKPIFERTERLIDGDGQRIEIFTLKKGCGCSFVFSINCK